MDRQRRSRLLAVQAALTVLAALLVVVIATVGNMDGFAATGLVFGVIAVTLGLYGMFGRRDQS